ncbi:MAG: hypothetical protein ACREKE_07420, partial [bacterium]
CGGAFYALTRPELISACAKRQKQPDWTLGLGFAGLLLLGWEFFAASLALDKALYHLGAWQGTLQDRESVGLALLAIPALVGLWQRRWWGWLAAGFQALVLSALLLAHSLEVASSVWTATQSRAPGAAGFMAGEAFCRLLPDLSVLICVLAAFVLSKTQFCTLPHDPRGKAASRKNHEKTAPI